MNHEDIRKHRDRIAAEREEAMFGTPPGADDDRDGDVPKGICGECDGDRWVPTGVLYPPYVPCPTCKGDGVR